MIVSVVLGALAALTGLASAVFWWRSAARSVPTLPTYWDKMPEDEPFIVAMRKTATDNRWAAGLSGVTALLGGLSAVAQSMAGH